MKIPVTFGLICCCFLSFGQREVKNEELAYLLHNFRKENYKEHFTDDGLYCLKIIKVDSKASYTTGNKGEEQHPNMHYFYLLSSTFGAASYTQAILSRTDDMINPKITGIREIREAGTWEISITYIKGREKIRS